VEWSFPKLVLATELSDTRVGERDGTRALLFTLLLFSFSWLTQIHIQLTSHGYVVWHYCTVQRAIDKDMVKGQGSSTKVFKSIAALAVESDN
jgi:hypothetical protein